MISGTPQESSLVQPDGHRAKDDGTLCFLPAVL
jgi:hypothetical protein